MSNAELFSTWYWSLGVAAVVVVIAAVLLGAILLVAIEIQQRAQQALHYAERIARDTGVIWNLADTNRVAADIEATARSIEAHGGRIAEALHGSAES